jgi:class 3 adenylate cyclase
LSLFSSKGIRFSGDSIKSCVGFIDLIDSTKNTITMEGLDYIRRYYSTFTNSIASLVSSSGGKVIRNTGDCILFYFPKTYEINDKMLFNMVLNAVLKF